MPKLGGVYICRLCSGKLVVGDEYVEIFSEDGIAARIRELVFLHFQLEVLPDDGISGRICAKCWSISEQFHHLYETVQLAQAALNHSAISHHRITTPRKTEDANATAGDYEIVAVVPEEQQAQFEFKSEVPDTALEDDGTMEVEVETATEYTTLAIEQSSDAEEAVLTVEAVEDGGGLAELSDYRDDDDEGDVEEGEPEANEEEEEEEEDDEDAEDDADLASNASSERRKKRRTAAAEDAQIRQYFDMNCTLCPQSFDTIHTAIRHYRRSHQQPGFVQCCDRKIYRRCMALDHIAKHVDPQQHRCAQCNKLYTSKATLRLHMRRHEPSAQFECDECPGQRFGTLPALAKHRRLEHGDAGSKEFGCDICGKFFVTKAVLTNHIRGVHENAFVYMCHICAKTFKSKQVFDLHQREHVVPEPPKLQCTICGNWLKHEHSLRKHMARHGQKEERCKLCNKVAPNRHALGNHMRYVHSERSYKCTMCEKAFKKPIGLKEHMASHMGVDLYFCPYCPKTFKSNANMHSHRKKKHLAQWQHDRELRKQP